MHALVSLLDKEHCQQVEQIWDELKNKFGLKGIRITPFPHFSWQVAGEYDEVLLLESMKEIAEKIQPFSVRTSGLGMFPGESPVIFVSVIKTRKLYDLHQSIWEAFTSIRSDTNPYYAPNIWVPHISLAYGDVSSEKVGEVMQYLMSRSFQWEIEIDNLSFICEPQGEVGILQNRAELVG